MTQSGQGEEPSAQPAHEGVVLPSGGGDPLPPGMSGGPGAPGPYGAPQHAPQPGQHHAPPQGGPGHAAPDGRDWGGTWGAADHYPHPQSGQGWPADPAWSPGPQAPAGPLPPENAQQPGYPDPAGPAAHGAPPPAGGAAFPPAAAAHADEGATQYLPPVPGAQAPYPQSPPGAPQPYAAHPGHPAQPASDEAATRYIPPVAPGALPPEAAPDSTQRLRRASGATAGHQPGAGPLPPAAGPGAEAATQYIPPVPAQPDAQAPYAGPGAPGGGPDHRQPPVEFDNLFRGASGPDGGAAATQQIPRYAQQPEAGHGNQPGYAPPGGYGDGHHGDGYADDHDGGRTRSRVPLFAGIGVAIAVVGIGAGALMGGSGDDPKTGDSAAVAATSPAPGNSPSPSADPGKKEAAALDKLLADSGSSRTAVIKAVGDIKACRNLGQAANDLRDAAKQRGGLVTRLSGLPVDDLAHHGELTTALTNAWKASASADNHYAAWADQIAADKKKMCPKGKFRSTGQYEAGNRASGTASKQKKTAAGLWNPIAEKYGLTRRQSSQL
ncbi:hypothetical protein ACL02U_18865 [Streptomyces sp. MS06]|uniref:hypothetical protein n=1 Tax=Streptomyces sp. MS06 TaxID=3385974 RepID=UPI0039A1A109